MLLYATIGQWTYASRITFSFMPDGTSIAGTPSSLFATMNAVAPTLTWQNQIEQAATPWESNANLNLALVSDNGAPVGTSGDQQDDPRFGDIRIGAMPLPSGVLAETFLPPPSNGGTAAGDIVFNSNVKWQIGGGYDLQTVAAHEFGHALGLGDQSTDPNSEMYYSYDGIKTALDSDDIAGIQSLYGAPQYDRFNTGLLKNNLPFTATNITSYIDGNGQIALGGLDNTLATQTEYYSVTVPQTNSGQMVVTLQSSNLSSLGPGLYVLSNPMSMTASAAAATTYGTSVAVTIPSVKAGQTYYIKVASMSGNYGRVGAYGLEVNFGSYYQPPVPPPNTLVVNQPDQGGGVATNAMTPGGAHGAAFLSTPGLSWTTIGSDSGWVETYAASTSAAASLAGQSPAAAVPTDPSIGIVGPTIPVALPGPATTPVTTTTTAVGLIALLPAPTPAAAGAPAPHKQFHHAVDGALRGWTSHRRRPQAGARPRSVLNGHDSLS
jgi:hypothetical protein